jgi:hypothetical protein
MLSLVFVGLFSDFADIFSVLAGEVRDSLDWAAR